MGGKKSQEIILQAFLGRMRQNYFAVSSTKKLYPPFRWRWQIRYILVTFLNAAGITYEKRWFFHILRNFCGENQQK